MTSRRNFLGSHLNMYGARSARPVEAREGGTPFSHFGTMPRRPSAYDDNSSSRGSRGKAAIVDEDARVGGSREHLRVAGFLGGGKSRGSIDHSDHHRHHHQRSNNTSPYGGRGFRDSGMVKLVSSRGDDAPLRGEGVRFRDGGAGRSRGERVARPAAAPAGAYGDEAAKWVMKGYDNLTTNSDGGFGNSLRDSDYIPTAATATKSTSSSNAILPGFIFECHRRTILDFFSQKGSFILPFHDRRLEEQVGPSTKIFMFDSHARELHGVFQAESYAFIDVEANTLRVSEGTAVRVRVRVAKECIPLTERQFKDILHENYYTSSKFNESLTKEQVMKLLQTFRPMDPVRSAHLSLPSRRDSGLSQDLHTISDDLIYRKEERWRRGAVDTRSLTGHSYQGQEAAARFSSKLSVSQTFSTKALDDYDDYGEDEVLQDLTMGTPRLISASNPYPSSRGKQQHSLRTLSGSRTGVSRLVGGVGHSELKLEADWREDIDPRDFVYRKRLSPSPLDEFKRGGRSASPSPWKDVHSRVNVVGEIYGRPGKGYKEDPSSFLSGRRHRHNDIDLNIPLEMGHGETSGLLHDVESKAVSRRKVWDDEEDKGYLVSPPPKGRPSLLPRSSLRLSNHHLLASDAMDDYDDSKLDSRHMVNASRKDYPLLRTDEKSRPISSSYSNGKFGKQQLRLRPGAPVVKNYPKDKSLQNPPLTRKRPGPGRDLYGKESTARGPKPPVFHIKANLQAPGRGKPERVVTLVDKDGFRSWPGPPGSREGNGSYASQGRKRKSVWSRITIPGKGGYGQQKGAAVTAAYGRGRVFSRLGPNSNAFFEPRDDTSYGYKNKKPRLTVEIDTDHLGSTDNIENSPDALEGEDYLNDNDLDQASEWSSEKEIEKTVDDGLQGWTRKKASVVNSGDESGIPDHSEYAIVKGGRRKLVRPSIGTKGEAEDESGWKHMESAPTVAGEDAEKNLATQPRRMHLGLTEMDMASVDPQRVGEGDSPLGSQQELNSPAEDEDNMMSS